MPNLRKGIEHHWRRLQRSNGIEGSFEGVRDGHNLYGGSRIVLARIDSQALTSREVIVDADSQDILIDVQDWLRGLHGPPQDGDKITYSSAPNVAANITAEVRPPSDSQPCFTRWYGETVYRVHCKVVERNYC